MKYEEFKTNLIEELKDFYGADATVELTTATKNNGIHLDGIIIRIGETNVAPIIYLQQYYEEYMENEYISIDEIVGRIVELRERHELQDADGVIGKITDWAYVREHIYPMIVSAEDNEEMLRALVSKPFLDLAVIMYIRLDDILQIGGEATVKVTNNVACGELSLVHELCHLLTPFIELSDMSEKSYQENAFRNHIIHQSLLDNLHYFLEDY